MVSSETVAVVQRNLTAKSRYDPIIALSPAAPILIDDTSKSIANLAYSHYIASRQSLSDRHLVRLISHTNYHGLPRFADIHQQPSPYSTMAIMAHVCIAMDQARDGPPAGIRSMGIV